MVALTAAIIMAGLICIFKFTPPTITIHMKHEIIQPPAAPPSVDNSPSNDLYSSALETIGAALQDFQGGIVK